MDANTEPIPIIGVLFIFWENRKLEPEDQDGNHLDEYVVVRRIAQQMMLRLADAIVALPGGSGKGEECIELYNDIRQAVDRLFNAMLKEIGKDSK